jgi:nitroimidazol reductase NimA-like FMN-containing flavoprotein (pyridoxamine 5'-phosphate oxidase superfamily)
MTDRVEPQASAVRLPDDYGEVEQLLPWEYARERLSQAQNYWLCTVSATGRPHAAPLWGAWVDDRLYISGSPTTRWGRNIASNPQVAVHLEDGNRVVMLEGVAEYHQDIGESLALRVSEAFAAKYTNLQLQERSYFVVIPRRAVAWSAFPKDATRWRFS